MRYISQSCRAVPAENLSRWPPALIDRVVDSCQGLPESIQVVGGLVRSRPAASDWKDYGSDWDSLGPDQYPQLQYCYEALPEGLKAAFQDIAVYFRGKEWLQVQAALSVTTDVRSHKTANNQQLNRLRGRSLIKEVNGAVWMHDLLIMIGKEAAEDSKSWAYSVWDSGSPTEV